MRFKARQRGYAGPRTDHFDGVRFHNLLPFAHRSFGDFLRWMWSRKAGRWSAVAPGALMQVEAPPERANSLRVTFINHATVLLQTGELNILTDPIWSRRASPVQWLGPRRVHPPGLRFEQLPPIDVVLVSHDHYDHMDLPTLKRLMHEHAPLFIVGLGNGELLQAAGIDKVREMDWWQQITLSPTTALSGVPAQHFSQRRLGDRDKRLWLGFVVHGAEGPVYFAGDTGMGPHFMQIRQRFGPMRLSLLPIGAYKPRWFMSSVHLSPQEAVQAHQQLESDYSLAIHFGTFQLADDGQYEAVDELKRARAEAGISEETFLILGVGEGRKL